jgi:hypothetical protein
MKDTNGDMTVGQPSFSRQRQVPPNTQDDERRTSAIGGTAGGGLVALCKRVLSEEHIASLGSACLVAMLAMPPFRLALPNGAEMNLGYSFILSPPEVSGRAGSVNTPLLATQAGVVLAVTGLLIVAARRRRSRE